MARCKGISYVGTVRAKPCSRKAHNDLPYCWQHGEQARDAVAALKADEPNSSDFMLQHLTYRGRTFEQDIFKTTISRKAPRALPPLDGNRDGLSLGHLEKIPLEVLYEVFSHLSIPDLRSFKATNSRGHLMASSDTRYDTIVTYAPGLIAALYMTGLQSAFTIGRIYRALTRSDCTICNSFGGYVFLPGLQRCCQRCAVYDTEMLPLAYSQPVFNKYNSKRKKRPLNAVPKMLISRNNYEEDRLCISPELDKSFLISRAEARYLGEFPLTHSRILRNLAVMPLPFLNLSGTPSDRTADAGYHCLGCAKATCGGCGYFGSLDCKPGCQWSLDDGIDVPYNPGIHDPSDAADMSCKTATARWRLYSKTDIVAHIASCSNVQDYLADLEIEKGRPPYEKRKKPRKYRHGF